MMKRRRLQALPGVRVVLFSLLLLVMGGIQAVSSASGEWAPPLPDPPGARPAPPRSDEGGKLSPKEMHRILKEALLEANDSMPDPRGQDAIREPGRPPLPLKRPDRLSDRTIRFDPLQGPGARTGLRKLLDVSGRSLTATALGYFGVPYQWAALSVPGFDCSGFIWRVFRKHGMILPRKVDLQFLIGRVVAGPR